MQREGPWRPDLAPRTPAEIVEEEPEVEVHPHLPQLSIWPITMALGIALVGLGFVTTFAMTFVGLFIMFLALVYWVQELRHEHQSGHH